MNDDGSCEYSTVLYFNNFNASANKFDVYIYTSQPIEEIDEITISGVRIDTLSDITPGIGSKWQYDSLSCDPVVADGGIPECTFSFYRNSDNIPKSNYIVLLRMWCPFHIC